MPAPEPITLSAADGRPLAGARFAAARPRAVAVLRGGTGIPARFYRHFAAALAGAGITTYTFDYRGIGASRTLPLRRDPAGYLDWAALDAPAVDALAAARDPGLPRVAVCHSFGGQTLGLHPAPASFDATLIIAAGTGYVGDWPAPERFGLRLLWHLVPPITAVARRWPGWLGTGEDLPRGVARDWARWCLDPAFLFGVVPPERRRYDRLTGPLTCVAFTDDRYAPPVTAEKLFAAYAAADGVHETVAPADVGLERIGHFGAFRPAAAAALWPRLIGHVERMIDP